MSDSGSVASYAALHSSSLATQRFQALSSMNQNLVNTTPSLNETNHSRGQSIDLGRGNVATTSARNSDFDRGLSRASSFRSIVSDTDTWIYDQNSLKDAPLASKLASPNRQVIEISFFDNDQYTILYEDLYVISLTVIASSNFYLQMNFLCGCLSIRKILTLSWKS
jgi:hypothetical protein